MTDGPAYALPDRPALDAESAAALAVMTALDEQLVNTPDAPSVVLDPRALAAAALTVVDGEYPRIPEWTEPRTLGGGKRPDDPAPQPSVTVRPVTDEATPLTGAGAGHIALDVEITGEDGALLAGTAVVLAEDAEQWALAMLAACRGAAARGMIAPA